MKLEQLNYTETQFINYMEVDCFISGNYTLITGTSNKIKKLLENQVDRVYFDSTTSLSR